MRKSLAAMIAGLRRPWWVPGHAQRRRRAQPSRATTRSATSSRSKSPGPMMSRCAPARNPGVSARGSRSCSSGRSSRSRATSSSIHPEHNHSFFHFGWIDHGQGQLHRDRPAAERRDHRRIGRRSGRQGPGQNFEGTVAGSGGLDVDEHGRPAAEAIDRGLGRRQGRNRQGAVGANMTSQDRATSMRARSRRRASRSRLPARAASRRTPAAPPTSASWARATSKSPGGAKCNISKAGLRQRPLFLELR